MASKVSHFTKKTTTLPKQCIPKVDIQISSQLKSNHLNTTPERVNVQNFPTRTRPKSLKKNQEIPSRTSTRASNSSTRKGEQPLEFRKGDVPFRVYANVSSGKKNETVCVSKEKEFKDYVKHYANTRIFGSRGKKEENVLLERRRRLKENKNENTKMPLTFTSDVVKERSEPHLVPYPGPNKELFMFKMTKTTKPRKLKPIGIISRHQVCLPCSNYVKFPIPDPRYLKSNGSNADEDQFFDIPSSTALWEQYVLSLVSKNTAQWIANRCSSGQKRSRLIQYLDDIYNVDFEEDGAITVRKLLENDDDCITRQNKSPTQTK